MTREEITPNMSHKEMIDTLKGLVFGTFNRTTAKEREALDMAIKELEQEPCEECVSRKDVLDMIEQIQDAGGFIGYNTYSNAFDVVDNMPPVIPVHIEQEPILDKIRAEIDSLEWRCDGEDYFVNRKAVKCILDKHKAESEVSKC